MVPAEPVMVPALVQEVGAMERVPAAVIWTVALLVRVVFWMVSVRPVASAEIRPLLTRVATELLDRVRSPPQPAARRTMPEAPIVTVPAPPWERATERVPAAAPSATTRELSAY